MTDEFKKYLLPDHSTRVQAVRLTESWRTGLSHQHYPVLIQQLLGELVSAAVLLASNIKFDGSLVLQLQGDGPVALLVVECTADLSIRATATLREGHEIPTEGGLQNLLNTQGNGRFIVVLDPNRETTDLKPYQGVVPLEGDTVAEVLQDYMRDSEQLDTRLWLASSSDHTAGLLLQRLPDHGGLQSEGVDARQETWERINHLATTVKTQELLDLDTDTLVHRLFWQEDLIAFDPQPVRWHCPCTRERVANMLRALGREEVEDILSEREKIDVVCNFCGKPYEFDAVDCVSLFVDNLGPTQGEDGSVH
ncbi:Hsp33 family molecular chaperone HslO [Pollutimonas thiosulfatoxidans]|uniref:Redox-regulated molecular chaperone Hsp33 n=1 Tax=Pollutimonas thiosulfatoxidans TaxID=2028345 RepID=A0A410G952_9BURK|nr:Hsp33 family molecular chaperone HslO [Pollutimonas thiosulfatoxidans]QAA92848.1 redox-regulated molecular chaperone Hsp33 [Pollutimonas thiosulfatoxidans]